MKKYVKFFMLSLCFLLSINFIGCSASKSDANIKDASIGEKDKKDNKKSNLLEVKIRGQLVDLYTDLDEEYVAQKSAKDIEEWNEFEDEFKQEINKLKKKNKADKYNKAQKGIEELFNEYKIDLNGNGDKSRIKALKKEIQSQLKND